MLGVDFGVSRPDDTVIMRYTPRKSDFYKMTYRMMYNGIWQPLENKKTHMTKRQEKELSENTKKLLKANMLNSDLSLNSTGRDALLEILAEKFDAELVAIADEKLAKKEKKSDSDCEEEDSF